MVQNARRHLGLRASVEETSWLRKKLLRLRLDKVPDVIEVFDRRANLLAPRKYSHEIDLLCCCENIKKQWTTYSIYDIVIRRQTTSVSLATAMTSRWKTAMALKFLMRSPGKSNGQITCNLR